MGSIGWMLLSIPIADSTTPRSWGAQRFWDMQGKCALTTEAHLPKVDSTAALPLRVESNMKRNIMGAALAVMLGMSALSAPQAIKAGGEMPLIGPAKVSSGRPPRRSGRGVRAARRAALKARNVARNRRAHR